MLGEVNEMPMGTLRKYEVQPLGNKGWLRSPSWRLWNMMEQVKPEIG
jgi:hypothetical protein